MNAAKAADTRALEFVILKNRHGAAFATVYMDYVPKFNRFTESSAE